MSINSMSNGVVKAKALSKHRFLPSVGLKTASHIVFCDFDSTYYDSHSTDTLANLRKLESFLENICAFQKIMVGWVTGTSTELLFSKIEKGRIRLLPHFAATSLGTELIMFNDESSIGIIDKQWQSKIASSQFLKTVRQIETGLKTSKISIVPHPSEASMLKTSYYYYSVNEQVDTANIARIKELAARNKLNVNVNYCSTQAGDPENCYDVNFMPLGYGKDSVVKYITDKYGSVNCKTIAFGDSGSDLNMLRCVHYGFLVANATDEAKREFPRVTAVNSTEGILQTLINILI